MFSKDTKIINVNNSNLNAIFNIFNLAIVFAIIFYVAIAIIMIILFVTTAITEVRAEINQEQLKTMLVEICSKGEFLKLNKLRAESQDKSQFVKAINSSLSPMVEGDENCIGLAVKNKQFSFLKEIISSYGADPNERDGKGVINLYKILKANPDYFTAHEVLIHSSSKSIEIVTKLLKEEGYSETEPSDYHKGDIIQSSTCSILVIFKNPLFGLKYMMEKITEPIDNSKFKHEKYSKARGEFYIFSDSEQTNKFKKKVSRYIPLSKFLFSHSIEGNVGVSNKIDSRIESLKKLRKKLSLSLSLNSGLNSDLKKNKEKAIYLTNDQLQEVIPSVSPITAYPYHNGNYVLLEGNGRLRALLDVFDHDNTFVEIISYEFSNKEYEEKSLKMLDNLLEHTFFDIKTGKIKA
ncbi:MAG: hypothetical protein HQK49_16700 [Oligoflexia bacterium]|nr:hypothetical protein [Oligoflexia bacterium]